MSLPVEALAQTSADKPRKNRRGPRKGASPEFDEAVEKRTTRMKSVGRPLPMFPTTADELAAQWNVSADDAWTVSVKISRQRLGSQEIELIGSVPLMEYSMEKLAGRYGPGMYFISGCAGKYAHNAAKMIISDAYARENGFGRLPTTAADLKAETVIRKSAEGPVDPLDLVAAIERILERREKEKAQTAPQQTAQGADIVSQMAMLFKGFELMSSMENKVMEQMERRAALMAGKTLEPVEEEGVMGIFSKILNSRAGEALVQGLMAPRTAAALPPAPTVAPAPAPSTAQAPSQGQPPVNLTAEEKAAIAPAVNMLSRFGANLVQAAAQDQRGPDAAAEELMGYIPPAIYASLVELAKVTANHGPAVLGLIHPGMATERWAAILSELDKIIQSPDESE